MLNKIYFIKNKIKKIKCPEICHEMYLSFHHLIIEGYVV